MKEITNYDFINSLSNYKVTKNEFNKVIGYFINKNIVGYIDYSIMYDQGELSYIYVIEEFRQNNIASELMEYMLKDMKKNNVKSVTLEVKVDNFAKNLYLKYGFKEISIRSGYYNGIDGLLMQKVI